MRFVKHIDTGTGGLRFDSLAGQIGHSVASGLPPLRRSFGAVAQALSRRDGPRTRYTLRHNTASVMKM